MRHGNHRHSAAPAGDGYINSTSPRFAATVTRGSAALTAASSPLDSARSGDHEFVADRRPRLVADPRNTLGDRLGVHLEDLARPRVCQQRRQRRDVGDHLCHDPESNGAVGSVHHRRLQIGTAAALRKIMAHSVIHGPRGRQRVVSERGERAVGLLGSAAG